MVERRLTLSPEVQEIFAHMDKGENFLLSGGAGSGKTHSLIEVINNIFVEKSSVNVACITYTNAAADEINRRISNSGLRVSTIHEFLWDNIKSYQKELKAVLITQMNNEENKKIKNPENDIIGDNYFEDKTIEYKEYTLIREGIISHDEVLIIANFMFEKYSKLSDILKGKFDYILVDEYQDTSPHVVEILLDYLDNSERDNIIGFFGDSMQSIYDEGVGDLNTYIDCGKLNLVEKKQNRRNPKLVYELANKLRNDGIIQIHSDDISAPNMVNGKVKNGSIKLYYTTEHNHNFNDLKSMLESEESWDFANAKEVKELNLTHNLISVRAGFRDLMAIYDGDKILDYKKRIIDYIKDNNIEESIEGTFGDVIDYLSEGKTGTQLKKVQPTPVMQTFIDENLELFEKAKKYPFEEFKKIYLDKDSLVDDKKNDEDAPDKPSSQRDALIKHLFKIQTNLDLYEKSKYNEFLRKTEFPIKSLEDKKNIKDIVDNLSKMSESTIEDIITFADEKGICKIDDPLNDFKKNNQYVYDRVKGVPFSQFQNLFEYIEGRTPFSTQHKIKGEEFDNVLIVLDNGNWNKYNFQYLFEGNGKDSVRERTERLFYVCCTRAKKNLVVYYHNPSDIAIGRAEEWFGKDNIVKM